MEYTQDRKGGLISSTSPRRRLGWGGSISGNLEREYEIASKQDTSHNSVFRQKYSANKDKIRKFDGRVRPLVQMIEDLPDTQDCSWEISQQLNRFTEYAPLFVNVSHANTLTDREAAQVSRAVKDLDRPGWVTQVAQVEAIAEELNDHIKTLSSLVDRLTVRERATLLHGKSHGFELILEYVTR